MLHILEDLGTGREAVQHFNLGLSHYFILFMYFNMDYTHVILVMSMTG